MKSAYKKSIRTDIKKNISKLVAIMAIVALGVGFLVGLMSSNPDLRATMDSYYDKMAFHDVDIKSTIGFSKDDVIKLRESLRDEAIVEGYSSYDLVTNYNSGEYATRLINKGMEYATTDKLELIEGRFPKNANECVVERSNGVLLDIKIGENIAYNDTTYNVVGIVASPAYITFEREMVNVGSGKLEIIMYINEDTSEFSDINVNFYNLTKLNTFSKKYDKLLNEDINKLNIYINEIFNERILNIKHNMIISGYSDEAIKSFVNMANFYNLTRNSNFSYLSYSQKIDMVKKISLVFPIFFFLIASLVSLTTITRMVSEDRSSIGCLRSLGYSKKSILVKYIIYVFIACGIGGVVGTLLGIFILPYIVIYSYSTLYFIPKYKILFCAEYIFPSVLTMLVVILLVTIYVCNKTLKEKPNMLLAPLAPKPGKRILLERISFIWKHLKFKFKSSIRNVFRYKKNFFVMILGVGGCSALLLCALTIKPSLNIANKQYDEIFNYDISLKLNSGYSNQSFGFTDYTYADEYSGEVISNGMASMIVYTNEEINSFINFKEKKKALKFTNESVFISKQIAQNNKLKIGDIIEFKVNDKTFSKIITGIFDNYLNNYIYIGDKNINKDTMYVKYDLTNVDTDELTKALLQNELISSVELVAQTKKMYSSMMDTINYIVIVVVICSLALAVIVIYNLTNININERIKEIATLKVLGYLPSEAAMYIYRETLIMTIIGTLLGLGLGRLLLGFILKNISSNGMYYVADASFVRYLLSFLFTVIFSMFVDLLFIRRIKKIKMVESLKSVD